MNGNTTVVYQKNQEIAAKDQQIATIKQEIDARIQEIKDQNDQ